jgi:hypothetical protein
MLKHCAANREIWLSALPNVISYIYDVKISGFTRSSIYTSTRHRRLRVKTVDPRLTIGELHDRAVCTSDLRSFRIDFTQAVHRTGTLY